MATNRKIANADHLSVTASHPTTPLSGQPIRAGDVCGVALIDERTDGLVTMCREGVFELSVKGVNDSGNSAVAAGDALFYVDADIGAGTGFLSEKASGRFFGYALEAVGSSLTADVDVLLVPASANQVPGDSLDGGSVAVIASGNTGAGIPVIHYQTIASGANGNSDIVITDKIRVATAWAILKGAGTTGSTIRITNGTGANHITDALDVASGGDRDRFDFGEIDDANMDVAAGGTLRFTKASTGGDFPGLRCTSSAFE